MANKKTWDEQDCRTWDIDKGIVKAVHILRENGINTFESCEGGAGHSYKEPTVAFTGTPEAGWRAVSICIAHGLPVLHLHRTWSLLDGIEPNGPTWQLVFRRKID